MVRDYSRKYSTVMGRQQPVARKERFLSKGSFLFSRVLGTVMMLVVIAALGASLWLNWRIEETLETIAMQTGNQNTLNMQFSNMQNEQQLLLAAQAVKKKAATLGLFVPERGQVRRP